MSDLPPSLVRHPELDTWVRVDPADTITLFTGKVELGQGLKAAIARIGAEELDVALERVRVSTADTAHGLNELFTVGSNSMEESGVAMRQAAAEARRHLLELAATRLAVPVERLEVEDGSVVARDTGARTTYWELLGGRRFARGVTGTVCPKRFEEHRIVGRAGRRADLVGLVTGTARYVHDLVRPGMLHARVARPPSPQARLVALDPAAVGAMPGVVAVVRDGSFLAVVAAREEQAVGAMEALQDRAQWHEEATLPPVDDLPAWLVAQPARSFLVVGGVAGDGPIPPIAPPAGAVRTLAATYTRPYQMHASVGPSAALAEWHDGNLTVWSHSQGISSSVRPSRRRSVWTSSGSARSTSRGPAATGTTVRTMRRSTPRSSRAPFRDAPYSSNGRARTSTPGSRTDRRWSSRCRRASTPPGACATGTTTPGVIRTWTERSPSAGARRCSPRGTARRRCHDGRRSR